MLNKLVLVVCMLGAAPYLASALYEVRVEKTVNGYLIQPKDTNTNTPLSPRLIGGEEVTPHKYPFQAALLIFKGNNTFFCGGTLITNQWVLTSARCIDTKPKTITVVLGAHDLLNLDINAVQVYNTSRYKRHSDRDNTFENDVGLIRLPSNATLNKNVGVVELAKGTEKYVGKEATTLGWGQTEKEALSYVLKQETSQIISNDDCAKINDNYKDLIKSTSICTSGDGPKGICNGDNGGPLLVDGVQVGIVSFIAAADCSSALPSVYTRETDFNDWIDKNLVDEGFDVPDDDGDDDDDGGDDGDDDDDNDDGGASTHSLLFVAIASTVMCLVRFFGLM